MGYIYCRSCWLWLLVLVVQVQFNFLFNVRVCVSASTSAGLNYEEALSKSLLFLEAQRSGRLPSSQRVTWRDHSGLTDGLLQGVDLVGGYYDAGDHVKFGLPMAFTVTMLSWSVIEYGKQIDAAGQLGYTMEAIKWGTDYFMKAHSEPEVLWGEVGDGDTDHYCWQRPEDMTTSRQAYKVDAANPGSDLAGETAAAMASASMAFRGSNPAYADLLLQHAIQLFAFADKYRGKYDKSISIVGKYYSSVSGYGDELLWAASWMYQATGNEYYLKYMVDNAQSLGGTGWAITEFSWDVKYAGLQVLAAKFLMEGKGGKYSSTLEQYQSKAEFFLCSCLQKNKAGSNIDLTPGGLFYIREWNNMQYVSSAAFLLTVYSDYLTAAKQQLKCPTAIVESSELLKLAKFQVDYILGDNPRATSYLVGFGKTYAQQVHHRGASIISYKQNPSFIGCIQGYDSWYSRKENNPNVIVGALVGGPDKNDNFEDNRKNYMQTEACTYNTAPLVGILSKFNGFKTSPKASFPANIQMVRYMNLLQQPISRFHPSNSESNKGCPVEFQHSVGDSWTSRGRRYFRHKVTVTNISHKPIRELTLSVKNVGGPLWGLSQSKAKDCLYVLPPWMKVLFPGHAFHFVYIQERGPKAHVAFVSYK